MLKKFDTVLDFANLSLTDLGNGEFWNLTICNFI